LKNVCVFSFHPQVQIKKWGSYPTCKILWEQRSTKEKVSDTRIVIKALKRKLRRGPVP